MVRSGQRAGINAAAHCRFRQTSSACASPRPTSFTPDRKHRRRDMCRIQRQPAGCYGTSSSPISTWHGSTAIHVPPLPESRKHGRNSDWCHRSPLDHVDAGQVGISWPAPGDSPSIASRCPYHPEFGSSSCCAGVWLMNPNGEPPAYEWAFGDVNRRCTPGPPCGCSRTTANRTAARVT